MKIGILLPNSKAYPTLGKQFMNGVKLALKEEDYTLSLDGIGFANDVDEIVNKIEKMYYQDNVDFVIGFVGDYKLRNVYEKLNALEVKAILCRAGAFPNINFEGNKYVHTVSYGLCSSLAHATDWSISNERSKIAVTGSYYEAGYGLMDSVSNALNEAGGVFEPHYFPPHEVRENEIEIAKEFYTQTEADTIICLYNGIYAEEHIGYIENAGKVDKELVFIATALNTSSLNRLSKVTKNIAVVASWLPNELRGEMGDFDILFSKEYNTLPDIGGVLGFEAGLGLLELQGTSSQKQSPRGKVEWNDELIFEPVSHVWKLAEKDGVQILKQKETLNKELKSSSPFEGQEVGWHNAYLCY